MKKYIKSKILKVIQSAMVQIQNHTNNVCVMFFICQEGRRNKANLNCYVYSFSRQKYSFL